MGTPRILVLHGPNLNLLGSREPGVYGDVPLPAIDRMLRERAGGRAVVESLQSNHEGVLIDRLQAAMTDGTTAVVLNPAGLTHTSVALRDAVVACGLPVIEVHLSNTAAREGFRRTSLIAAVAAGTIAGFGPDSYLLGLEAALSLLARRT